MTTPLHRIGLRTSRTGRRRHQGGNAMIEFALSMAFLTPLLLGTFNVGMNLGRNLQVTQLARNAGHMYVRWVDFSLPATQDMIVRLGQGLNLARAGGDGVVILSQITVPADADCTAANLSLGSCTNRGLPVFIHRIAFGNLALRSSAFGTPAPALVDSTGAIAANSYLADPGARATNWTSVLTLEAGEVAFVAEVYVRSPNWDVGGESTEGVYARAIY